MMIFVAHFLLVAMSFFISIVVTFIYAGFLYYLDDSLLKKYKGKDYIGFLSKRICIFFVIFFIIMIGVLEIIFYLLP